MGSGGHSTLVSFPVSVVGIEPGARKVHEKLQEAKMARTKAAQDKKAGLKGPSPIKEIMKHRKTKKLSKAGVLETISDMQLPGACGAPKMQEDGAALYAQKAGEEMRPDAGEQMAGH
jgi:hypothetical protein